MSEARVSEKVKERHYQERESKQQREREGERK